MDLWEAAAQYIESEVLHNAAWTEADRPTQERALKAAENQLYLEYTRFDREKKPIDQKAIFEQAVWLLRMDDAVLKAEQGVTNINISGEFSMGLGGTFKKISPMAVSIIRKKRVGRYI